MADRQQVLLTPESTTEKTVEVDKRAVNQHMISIQDAEESNVTDCYT